MTHRQNNFKDEAVRVANRSPEHVRYQCKSQGAGEISSGAWTHWTLSFLFATRRPEHECSTDRNALYVGLCNRLPLSSACGYRLCCGPGIVRAQGPHARPCGIAGCEPRGLRSRACQDTVRVFYGTMVAQYLQHVAHDECSAACHSSEHHAEIPSTSAGAMAQPHLVRRSTLACR